nr:hypothetical protein [uncultured Romboutsia sp.]
MSIIVRDWTEFSDEVELYKGSFDGNPKVLFNEINSKEDINAKDYPVKYKIKIADEIFDKGGRLIQEDIKGIKSNLYEFGVAIVKAIDGDNYKRFGMREEDIDALIKTFREYAEETKTREMRMFCQD